jgi:predicted Fe-Mo cluster-binding NifX family protein
MVKYKCQRCGFETNHKNNFRKHLFRKFTCKPLLKEMDIKIDQILHFPEEGKNCNPNVIPSVILLSSKCNPKSSENLYFCEHCGKKFKQRQNKWRHKKYNCEKKKLNDNKMVQKLSKLENDIVNLKKENKMIIKNSINNSKINSDNTIIVNNFGRENLNYLNNNMLKKILMKGTKSISSLIKQIHFNPKHPENHNIRIKNKKLKYAEVRENDKWKYKHKQAVLDDLVDFGYITLEEFKENNENELDELLRKGFNRMMNKYELNKEKIMNEIELEVLNGMNDIEI